MTNELLTNQIIIHNANTNEPLTNELLTNQIILHNANTNKPVQLINSTTKN